MSPKVVSNHHRLFVFIVFSIMDGSKLNSDINHALPLVDLRNFVGSPLIKHDAVIFMRIFGFRYAGNGITACV